jgi:hypothetical protein
MPDAAVLTIPIYYLFNDVFKGAQSTALFRSIKCLRDYEW